MSFLIFLREQAQTQLYYI